MSLLIAVNQIWQSFDHPARLLILMSGLKSSLKILFWFPSSREEGTPNHERKNGFQTLAEKGQRKTEFVMDVAG